MTTRPDQPLCVGFLAIGRKRPGFDPEWGQKMAAAAWEACEDAPLQAVRPAEPVVDDTTLRQAIAQFRQAGCQTLLVLQPTMGDGRLAPILAQLWNDPVVLWATPERLDTDRVSACSLVGTHVFASMLRQMQRPFEMVYGSGDDEATRRQMVTAARLTATAAQLRRAKVGLVGYHAPGFINVHADPITISRELGAQLQHIGLAEFQARVESCGAERIESDLQAVLDMQLSQIERQEKTITDLLAQSAAQRQNLLKAAFSGQLVPHDPADEPASVLLERIRAEHTTRKRPTRRVSHA